MISYRKITGLLLTAALAAGILTGCGGTKGDTDSLVYKAAGVTPETVLMTVNGIDVTAEVYYYWLAYSCDYMAQYSDTGEIDWEEMQQADEEEAEVSTADYVKDDALNIAKLYAVVEAKAKEYDCGLTEEDQSNLDSMRASFVSQLGGEEAYAEKMRSIGLSDETFMKLNSVSYMYQNLKSNLYTEGGAFYPTDEELTQYASDNGYLHANHILFSTLDDDGNPIPDDEKAKVLARAKEVLAQLRASDDPLTLFNTLAAEYTDDTGYSSNPDGYQFTPGTMVEDFESAVQNLDINEISDIVETDFGYHIILRLPVDTSKLVDDYSDQNFDERINQWQEEAKVSFKSAYDKVDPEAYYTKLLTLREELEAEAEAEAEAGDNAAEATDAGAASPSPTAAG